MLEHGNSVSRQKGFYEADKVNFLLFCSNIQNFAILAYLILEYLIKYRLSLRFCCCKFWITLLEARPFCERPGLPVRSPGSLWDAWPSNERPYQPLRGLPPCESLAFWEKPGLPVTDLAFLWEDWLPWERPRHPLRGSETMWEAWPSIKRPNLPVRGPASLWEDWFVVTK